MRNLSQLDKNELSNIIRGFANKIFQSEAQFQFDLAWELKRIYNCNVILEDKRAIKTNTVGKIVQKFYTDIVLEDVKDNYSVAIELKYKTAEYPRGVSNPILFDHDAVDLGRYDYLWDVYRIELFTGKSTANGVSVTCKCNKGFAVLLTNEKKYWQQSYINSANIDKEFLIGAGTNKLYSNLMDWKKDPNKCPNNYMFYPKTVLTKTNKPTFRAQPIHLDQAYKYKWEVYQNTGQPNGDFKFVIIEV